MQRTASSNSFFERYIERQVAQKRGLSSDFERLQLRGMLEQRFRAPLWLRGMLEQRFIEFSRVLEQPSGREAGGSRSSESARERWRPEQKSLYIYIYIYREREREREPPRVLPTPSGPKVGQSGRQVVALGSQKVAFRAPVVPLGSLAIAS